MDTSDPVSLNEANNKFNRPKPRLASENIEFRRFALDHEKRVINTINRIESESERPNITTAFKDEFWKFLSQNNKYRMLYKDMIKKFQDDDSKTAELKRMMKNYEFLPAISKFIIRNKFKGLKY